MNVPDSAICTTFLHQTLTSTMMVKSQANEFILEYVLSFSTEPCATTAIRHIIIIDTMTTINATQ